MISHGKQTDGDVDAVSSDDEYDYEHDEGECAYREFEQQARDQEIVYWLELEELGGC